VTGERTLHERETIDSFLRRQFPDELCDESTDAVRDSLSVEERGEIDALVGHVDDHFGRSKGTLGLGIDFLIVAEQLSRRTEEFDGFDPDVGRERIFDRFSRKDTSATLTFLLDGNQFGIRSVHNDLITLFRDDLGRTNFPSSPGHHTGEWERYEVMLERAFRLSRRGRYVATRRLFEYGLEHLRSKSYASRDPPFPTPFGTVLTEYSRSHPEEEGGSAYQALCYGFVRAQWPHLSLRASKVRTGSSRQHRYGDVDGYLGPDLMISVEVKDLHVDQGNVRSELGTTSQVAERTTAIAIAICRSVSDDAREMLEAAGVRVLDDDDLETRVRTWDYHKQNRAVQAMLHFFSNVEENPAGTQRLLRFLDGVDPNNRALVHLEDDTPD
jgi:hypothetical protein